MKILLTALALALAGCTSSQQSERHEQTTTTVREFRDTVQVPVIEGTSQSLNYFEWRKAIVPILEFVPPAEIPIIEKGDTLGNVSLDLQSGKSKFTIKPKPVIAKGLETKTESKVDTQSESETESWFEKPLLYGVILASLLLAGFLAYKLLR